MIISILSSLIIIFLSDILQANQLIVTIDYRDNDTLILYYNLTTNSSYYLTFRVFEQEQIKFGLFSSDIQENTLQITHEYHSENSLPYLFIVCFHFLYRLNEIDIQCKDINLIKSESIKTSLPSYKPLFVPMMYALSILMLLPVIIQHRRQKYVKSLERRKQIRRLSMTIVQDHPNILSNLAKRVSVKLPIDVELLSIPSTKTILDDINDDVSFTKTKPRILIDDYDREDDVEITADDCIAHLLNNTPWSSTPAIVKDSGRAFDDQYVPMMSMSDETEKFNRTFTIDSYRLNPAFVESEV